MKSLLRRLTNSFLPKPEAVAETTWHPEDFRAAPDRPALADPWAPDAGPTALRERPAAVPDAAPLAQPAPVEGLPPRVAPQDAMPRIKAARAARTGAGGEGAPLQAQDASPEPPPSAAELLWSATSLIRRKPADAQPAAKAPPDATETQDAPTVPACAAGSGAMAAASRAQAAAPLEPVSGSAPTAPEARLGWDDAPPAAALRDQEVLQSQDGAGATAPEEEGDDIASPGPPDARRAEEAPQAASEVGFVWESVTLPAGAASFTGISVPDRPQETAPYTDWDDFAPGDPAPPPPVLASAYDDDFDLPEYDPGLSQRLGDAEWAAKAPRDALARQRAGMIAALLDVTSRREADAALQWLEAFFLEHRWPATFSALEAAALEGLDFPTLRTMSALKDIWAERPDWWLRRIRTNRATLGGTATEQLPRGDTALSWRLARRICLARCDFPPEEVIDPDWLMEWFTLPPDEPGASFFTSFLDEKAAGVLAEALHEGLAAKAREDEPPSQGQRLAPRRPLPCGPAGELVSPVMVDVTGQPKKRTDDDG